MLCGVQELLNDVCAVAVCAAVQFHKPVLPVESHHAMHPVVRVASSAAAEALASLGPDSPPDSTPNNTHNEEMAPTTMVACS